MHQLILNRSSEIVRKYQLGDQELLKQIYPDATDAKLTEAWKSALAKVRHVEIVKNSSDLSEHELLKANAKVLSLGNDPYVIYGRLLKRFKPESLRLSEEKIERRVLHLLAKKYLRMLKNGSIELSVPKPRKTIFHSRTKSEIKAASSACASIRDFYKQHTGWVIAAGLGILFYSPRIIDGLTPSSHLAKKIHKESAYQKRVGATCWDGWKSSATGQGACSHHGGVKEWRHKTVYRKTRDEAEKEARRLSWLD